MKAKRLLQIIVAIGALVPILAGLSGVLIGQEALDRPETLFWGNHYRYLSGLLLGIGLCFWSTIPSIERKSAQFQLLAMIVFIGGLSRLYGVFVIGAVDHGVIFSLIMELIVTPGLAFWQRKIARAYH